MGWFLLYWFVGVIATAWGKYKLDGTVTVGNLFACFAAALVWPLIIFAFLYVEYEDRVIFEKKNNKRNRYE